MGFHIFYTITLQAGCKFSLSIQMYGYTLQADVGFFFLIIFHEVSYFHTLTPQAGCRLSLSMQMFGVHAPSRCWLFQKKLFNLYFSWGLTSFIPSLSRQVVSSHSPNRCWLFQFFLFLMQFHIFYTNTLQAGLRFMLSMQMFGLHSPSRCWLF